MDKRSLLFGLHELPGVGWKTILQLFGLLEEPSHVLEEDSEGLQRYGLMKQRAELIATKLSPSFIEERKARYEKAGIRIVTIFDNEYPQLLRETAQPPWVLYTIGEVRLLTEVSVAMVGTRTPTVYGKRVADTLSEELSAEGLCIVSGLARGIDSAAHRGAMKGKGSTIAVLGCGIDIVYPPENANLYREIAERGLIVAEQPAGTAAKPGLFPLRNRIIAGIARGTIVVEAAERSGSLITADQALECSRDVFAVPGPITSPKSQGALSLIKQGAKVVTGAADVVEEYAFLLKDTISHVPSRQLHENRTAALTEEERRVYELLSPLPTSFDQIMEHTQTNFGHLHAILLSLQMRKMIEQLPGPAYVIT
ncbi:DNA-processing protein DprA [Paenibacillus sp. MBLB4367]|uniref:DNA-processing protein DprA n=1 Tax=Paenibacillus sp. MBLB4367 TaxID=3384767 RepID=UPI0039081593